MDMLSNRSGTIILALWFFACNAFGAQAYYSPISINAAQVPSTQTDFPVLVSQTDNRFKTIGNGGHVANANGYDIRPYSDTGLTTSLSYELERYNGTTGEVVMWVKVGSLSSSTTPIYLGYGDAGLTTDGSSTTTWSNNFLAVYHVKDGTTLSVADSTGTFNGTNHSSTATTGKIDGGANFVAASTQYIDLGNGINPASGVSYSAWVKASSFPGTYNGVIARTRNTDNTFLFVKSNGKVATGLVANDQRFIDGGSTTLSTGTWYYLTMVYDGTVGLIQYVNASSDGTQAANGTPSSSTTAINIGRDPFTSGREWNGDIDEARIASVARSANWITTEYNNQSAPATFETLGTEVAFSGSQRGWFMFFPQR